MQEQIKVVQIVDFRCSMCDATLTKSSAYVAWIRRWRSINLTHVLLL